MEVLYMNEIDLLKAELRNFLDASGKLTKMPVKRKKKLAFLVYIAPHFQAGVPYTEKQINEVINQWHTYGDPVTIRRELVEHGILSRDKAGHEYRRTEDLPDLTTLLERYQ
jgi:hypothetical protein